MGRNRNSVVKLHYSNALAVRMTVQAWYCTRVALLVQLKLFFCVVIALMVQFVLTRIDSVILVLSVHTCDEPQSGWTVEVD